MSEEIIPEDYEVLEIPLNATMTDVRIPLDCEIMVVAQCPIAVTAKINDVSRNGINLQLVRTFKMRVKRLFITTTTTSSDSLILFVSKTVEVEAAPASGRVQLVDATEVIYDARDVVENTRYQNEDNINDGATKNSGTLTTTGFNKICVSVYSSHALTVQLEAKIAGATNWRELDEQAVAATTGTSIEWSVVAESMRVQFSNGSGANTTTCETEVFLSTGA